MSPTIGSMLGPYEILERVGVGGMGEVYKARDTRLGRIVAIKFSKEQFTDRFEREAKAVAALNHPNICHLYDVGPDYLVMEFVDGKILHGPLDLEEALRVAGQIANALDAAHEKGIVHRDLKPANILIKDDGSVKVLDFGLAKLAGTEDAPPVTEDSPTVSISSTRAGMILGTAAYMSPEQARGKAITPRADIWAFGVVLYELITGQRLFHGEDLTEVLASVVKEQPDLKDTPVEVRKLLEACLQKDPKNRLQAIGDWKLLLDRSHAATTPPSKTGWLWPLIASFAVIGLGTLAFVHFRESPPVPISQRFSLALLPDSHPSFVSLSPDGQRLLAVLLIQNAARLYTRAIDQPEYHALEGPLDPRGPFWSPDGRFIGYFADGALKTIPWAGGPIANLCSGAGMGVGGAAWSRSNVIVYFTDTGVPFKANPSGGACVQMKLGDDTLRGSVPEFLPDGNHFLFVGSNRADATSRGVYVTSLDGAKPRKVLNDYSSVVYSPPQASGPAHLLFLRGSALMAQPFDTEKLEAIGDPFTVASQASSTLNAIQVGASVDQHGTLIYLNNRTRALQTMWVDRSGKELDRVGAAAERTGISLSPDGTMLVMRERTPTDPIGALHILDMTRKSDTRFLPEGDTGSAGVWSPDGARIAYAAPDGAAANLFVKNSNGEGPATRLLLSGKNDRAPSDWSADGRFLIYMEIDSSAKKSLWYLPNPLANPGDPQSKPVPFLPPDVEGAEGQLSPNGRWLAYSGEPDVVALRAFPSGDRLLKIADNAVEARWARNGRELYYLVFVNGANEVNLMSVTFQESPGGAPQLGPPVKLFSFQSRVMFPRNNQFSYASHPDGKRFLLNVRPSSTSTEVNVITNWQSLGRSAKQ